MYIIVFGLSMHVFRQRKRPGLKLYRVCTVLLFTLATVYVTVHVFGLTRQTMIDYRATQTRDFESYMRYLVHDDVKAIWG